MGRVGGVSQALGKGECFIMLEESIPGRLFQAQFDQGHVETMGDSCAPGRAVAAWGQEFGAGFGIGITRRHQLDSIELALNWQTKPAWPFESTGPLATCAAAGRA